MKLNTLSKKTLPTCETIGSPPVQGTLGLTPVQRCIHHFSHFWDQMASRNNGRFRRVYLVHSLRIPRGPRVPSAMEGKAWRREGELCCRAMVGGAWLSFSVLFSPDRPIFGIVSHSGWVLQPQLEGSGYALTDTPQDASPPS